RRHGGRGGARRLAAAVQPARLHDAALRQHRRRARHHRGRRARRDQGRCEVSAHDEWLTREAERRRRDGLHRELRPRDSGAGVIDLAGNDYLGLARDPRVIDAAVQATREWGTGSTGSRLVTGTTRLHVDLERELAAFAGSPDALVFASGYAANLAVLTALADEDTLIVSDERNHASLIDGCRLAAGRTVVTPHRDVDAVATALRDRPERRALVVTDAVFSVDGALAPVADLHRVAREHGALLVLDEAHALGVVGKDGRGLAHEIGLETDVVRTVTLSKSLGAQGGAVLAG